MLLMKSLNDDYKLSFRSTSEINEAFGIMVLKTSGDKSIRFRGKKPTRAAVINALVLWAASRPPDEQKNIIREGMLRLNELLAEPEEGQGDPGVSAVEPPLPPVQGKARKPGKRGRSA